MKLPTPQEFALAAESYMKDPPVPMAGCVDRSEDMSGVLAHIRRQIHLAGTEQEFLDYTKSLLVVGLNIGIRIGEARRPLDKGISLPEALANGGQ